MQSSVTPAGAAVPGVVESLQKFHIAHTVQADTSGKDEPVTACRLQRVRDEMEHHIFKDELGCSRFIDPLLRRF